MSPSTIVIESDLRPNEELSAYRRRVAGDSTRTHWSRARARARRQWRQRARRI